MPEILADLGEWWFMEVPDQAGSTVIQTPRVHRYSIIQGTFYHNYETDNTMGHS